MEDLTTRGGELSSSVAAQYLGLVHRGAHKLARHLPAHVNVDDLIGAGMVGLADALRRRTTSGDHFEAYAGFRIRGAMLDELRASDPLSRDMRDLNKRIVAAMRDLTQKLGRPPEEAEIAERLAISVDALQSKLATLSFRGHVALDTTGSRSDSIELGDEQAEGAETQMLRAERRARLAQEVAWLPPRLRQVLKLYYEDECTLREIGQVLGITESRVSQLHSQAIVKLRAACAKASTPPPAPAQPRPASNESTEGPQALPGRATASRSSTRSAEARANRPGKCPPGAAVALGSQ
jgi:RNA polymerase sigma factor for flagellar operon FliA